MPALIAPASPVWFFARAAGFVSLLLLTASVCLGILVTMRARSRTWPLFLTDEMHGYTAVLFFVFLALHVVTVLVDPFTRFGLSDVLVPFASSYRRVWLGLGVLGAELAVALALSVFIRRRIGYRAWRVVHYATYAVLPMALVHGLATGSDTRSSWGIAVYGVSLILVAVVLTMRIGTSTAPVRWPLAGAVALGAVLLVAWLSTGPLRAGWAREAGTPQLDHAVSGAKPQPSSSPLALARPFVDAVTGSMQSQTATEIRASGRATGAVDLGWALDESIANGSATGTLTISATDGSPICAAVIQAAGRQGVTASCAPTHAQGGLTFVLRLRPQGRGALSGALAVQRASPGRLPVVPTAVPAGTV